MPSAATVVQVCCGRTRQVAIAGRSVATAIAKSPVQGRVAVGPLGLAGDLLINRVIWTAVGMLALYAGYRLILRPLSRLQCSALA